MPTTTRQDAAASAPLSRERRLDAAARRLAASRAPLFAGLGVDSDGARAAVALAERLGGVIDHMHSGALLRDLDCMRETGVFATTPIEARARGDLILLVGDAVSPASVAITERLLAAPLAFPATGTRAIVWLARNADERAPAGVGASSSRLETGLPIWLAALRARVKGRPVADFAQADALDRLAATLKAAKFGVAVWSAAELDAMELETVNGLVRDLNETTRFTSLPLPPGDNAAGALAACGWMTGFPMRTGFGPSGPDHDPWRFEAARLVEAKETDCVVWLSAFGAPPPAALAGAIDIAICDDMTGWTAPLHIEVGRPGRDHDAVLHDAAVGTLTAVRAQAPTQTPSVAATVAELAARLGAEGAAWPC
jgi:formylmethanofuran dehydrogenase subunit B